MLAALLFVVTPRLKAYLLASTWKLPNISYSVFISFPIKSIEHRRREQEEYIFFWQKTSHEPQIPRIDGVGGFFP